MIYGLIPNKEFRRLGLSAPLAEGGANAQVESVTSDRTESSALSPESSHTSRRPPGLGRDAAFSPRCQALPTRTGLTRYAVGPFIGVMSIHFSWDTALQGRGSLRRRRRSGFDTRPTPVTAQTGTGRCGHLAIRAGILRCEFTTRLRAGCDWSNVQ